LAKGFPIGGAAWTLGRRAVVSLLHDICTEKSMNQFARADLLKPA